MIDVESSVLGRAAYVGGHGPHVGRWVLTLRDRKPLKLQLESVADMQKASRSLPAFGGGRHRNEVVWNAESRRFVSQTT